jgi:hypothetical protein
MQVGDPEHVKVFGNQDAAERDLRRTLKALRLSTRFWNE